MSTAMNQPDIEIYLKNASVEMIASWLVQNFDSFDKGQFSALDLESKKQHCINLSHNGTTIELIITPQAAGKAFCSIWFKSDLTPWSNDLECADSFLSMHDIEVRCSAESWTEEEAEFSEKWWKLSRESRDLIVWG